MLVVIYVDVQKEYNKNVFKKASINRSKKRKWGGGPRGVENLKFGWYALLTPTQNRGGR